MARGRDQRCIPAGSVDVIEAPNHGAVAVSGDRKNQAVIPLRPAVGGAVQPAIRGLASPA